MKKIASYYLVLSVTALVGLSCKDKKEVEPEPVAIISYTDGPIAGAISLNGRFSTNATTYLWDLGNGKTDTNPTLIANYDKNGTYTVRLTVISPGGKTAQVTQQVSVKSVKGRLSFFTDTGYPGGIDVWVNNVMTGHLGVYYPSGLPVCGDNNTAQVYLPQGVYPFYAKQSVANNPRTWTGTVEITDSGCKFYKIPN